MKAYGGVDVEIHIFLTSALVAGEKSASGPGERVPGTHWIVDSQNLFGRMEKRKFLTIPGLELRPLGRLACCQPLYPLRYPASYKITE
jgi:hypothetical protein